MKLEQAPAGSRCPACGLTDLLDFFHVGRLPIHVGVLWASREEARQAPMGEVTLCWCRGCGFVHNRTFEPAKVTFEPGYEVSLAHSEMFRSFMQALAERLIERYDLRDKTIIEIGCGEARFLRQLCRMGPNDGIGIDPTVEREGVEKIEGRTIRFIRDLFSERYVHLEGDFVCCLSVFEDIPRPIEFLATVRKMIGDRRTPIYFEIFNGMRAFRNQETWSVHYEQCNYFGPETFPAVFERAGFEVTDAGPCYGEGQYLFVEAVPRRSAARDTAPTGSLEVPLEVSEFAEIHSAALATWKTRLEEFRRDARRVVVWGSGGKGISFLNAIQAEECISYVADINPARQDRYVPGAAQRVVAPEFLTEYRPQTVIITNQLYEQEIRKQVADLGLACDFFTA